MRNTETSVLKGWHIRITLLVGIVTPCLTASGAYYGLKLEMAAQDKVQSDRVSSLELKSTEKFVAKDSFHELVDEVKNSHDDILKIKTLLERQ